MQSYSNGLLVFLLVLFTAFLIFHFSPSHLHSMFSLHLQCILFSCIMYSLCRTYLVLHYSIQLPGAAARTSYTTFLLSFFGKAVSMIYYSHFHRIFEQENRYLTDTKEKLEIILQRRLPGNLRIHRKNGRLHFGIWTDSPNGGKTEKYISNDDFLLPHYINKYCAKKSLICVKKLIVMLQTNPSEYSNRPLQEVFEWLEIELGDYLPEFFRPNSFFIVQWEQQHFPSNPYKKEELLYTTKRVERVRSKLECLCADVLYDLHIPYQYEKRLVLKNGRIIYPDFTLLSPVSGKVYYLEICGMMDNAEYRKMLFDRLDQFAESGIIQGKNLLMVFESQDHPFNRNTFVKMLEDTILEA